MFVVTDQDGNEIYFTRNEWRAMRICDFDPEAPELTRTYAWEE